LNNRLEIIVGSGKNARRFHSRIEGLTEEHLLVAMPMEKSVPVILLPGTAIRGRIVANNISWEFTSILYDKRIAPLPIWVIKMPGELTKIQLRDFVRIPANVPAQIRIITDGQEAMTVAVNTKDISGGGVQFISKERLPVGTKLKVSMDLGISGIPVATAEVIRVETPPGLNIYWIAAKFTDIIERNREIIIKYIFKKQTERRQKELT